MYWPVKTEARRSEIIQTPIRRTLHDTRNIILTSTIPAILQTGGLYVISQNTVMRILVQDDAMRDGKKESAFFVHPINANTDKCTYLLMRL